MKNKEIMVGDTNALNIEMEEEEKENYEKFFQIMAQLVKKYGKSILENTDHTA